MCSKIIKLKNYASNLKILCYIFLTMKIKAVYFKMVIFLKYHVNCTIIFETYIMYKKTSHIRLKCLVKECDVNKVNQVNSK